MKSERKCLTLALLIVCAFGLTSHARATEARLLAHDIGLTPEVLAAAGYNAAEVADVVERAVAATQERANLSDARLALSVAVRAEADAVKALSLDPANEELQSLSRSKRSDTVQARVACHAAQLALRTIALGPSDSRRAIAERIIAVPFPGIPIALRTCETPGVMWERVLGAVTEEARADRCSSNVLSDESGIILHVLRSNSAVILAQQQLDANLVSIQTAWLQQ